MKEEEDNLCQEKQNYLDEYKMNFFENQEPNLAKATVKSQEKSDLIRNLVSLCEMLCYECNQWCFNSVKFKKHIQNIHVGS